ncbi:MAG: TIGR02757 family protein [Weeksellaceae bacterium]|nr:TIGR02757 family protein [Weeksellaceae bacterium]
MDKRSQKHLQSLKSKWKDLLDERADFYNQPHFIATDPIQIPHRFSLKQDIEIAGFLLATIAWGNRKSIIRSGERLMHLMDDAPYEFLMNSSPQEILQITGFVHRTFSSQDLQQFLLALKELYSSYDSLEDVLLPQPEEQEMSHALERWRSLFMQNRTPHCGKHFSSPYRKSAAKRLHMYLRWMVRKDDRGVDFGVWERISPALLSIPLDVHSAKVAREMGLLQRKQNDYKAVQELDEVLRFFDAKDPVKYDFALFGISAIGEKL